MSRLRTLAWAAVVAAAGLAGKALAARASAVPKEVQVWDISGGGPKPLQLLEGHSEEVAALSFAPDGRTVATVGRDRTLRLWPLTEEGAKQLGLKDAKAHIAETLKFVPTRVAFLRDG